MSGRGLAVVAMPAPAKPATYDDLLALPEEVYAEVIAGELITMPTPYPRHSWSVSAISNAIAGPFDQDHGGLDGWWILGGIDVAFGEHDIVRPDLIGWRRDRLSDFWQTRPITVVPDWICEVTETPFVEHDRVKKAGLYLKHGVGHYWLADPEGRTLSALERTDACWAELGAYGDGDRARLPPFAELELEVGALFMGLDRARSSWVGSHKWLKGVGLPIQAWSCEPTCRRKPHGGEVARTDRE